MTDRKFTIFAGFPAYAGNGGYSSVLPKIMFWWHRTYYSMRQDPAIERVYYSEYCDTPITMVRNKMVVDAKRKGADFLLMVDSDNAPDTEPDGKLFWDSSWEFLRKHYDKGPSLVFAPYCGPPDNEAAYVFKWAGVGDTAEDFHIEMMNREEAAMWTGIVDVAAGPTGLMLIDMRCFDLINHPYFDYEWKDETASEKASTEDVYFTRNVSLNGLIRLGYNPVYCNFDSWAGHAKQKMVKKPRPLSAGRVARTLRDAVLSGRQEDERLVILGENANRDETGMKARQFSIKPEKHAKSVDLWHPHRFLHSRPDTLDSCVIKEVATENCYKLPDRFPPDSLVIDVGAHIGVFALECVKRGAGKVVCYEPEPENFALLRENTKAYPNIECHQIAIWKDEVPVELIRHPDVAGTACHYVRQSSNGKSIKSLTLETVLRDRRVDLLKLDCEGAETALLTADLQKVERIVMEVHGAHVNPLPLRNKVESSGFTVFRGIENSGSNELWFCERGAWTELQRAIRDVAADKGEMPNVVTVESSTGTKAIEAADAGAFVYTVRPELSQAFRDAAGPRLGDNIDVLTEDQWPEHFHATADIVWAETEEEAAAWKDKCKTLLVG